ncbi:MAG: exodeoxyribonuclease VII small subunit [Coriobacteriales bacterium]|nr:exodeoxyribonuclease VII small subunit [Coriobacteriales bacterium]
MADNRPESSYLRVKNHLDAIAEQIRSTDLPLEKALDLYEEAIRLGNSCADLIDMTDFSLEEIEAFNNEAAADGADDAADDQAASAEVDALQDAAETQAE